MTKGTIKKLVTDRGFGFIVGDDGKEYFFHMSETDNFDGLLEGDVVMFEVDSGPRSLKGPRARHVVVAGAAPSGCMR